jgi:transposase
MRARGPVAYSVAAFRRAWLDPTLSTPEIARRFGIVRSTAVARARALGLPRRCPGSAPVLDDVQRAELLRMHALGMSHGAIAEFFGCHWMTVLNCLRRAGAPSRGTGRPSTMTAEEYRAFVEAEERGYRVRTPAEVRDALLLEMVAADVARAEIARVLGLRHQHRDQTGARAGRAAAPTGR